MQRRPEERTPPWAPASDILIPWQVGGSRGVHQPSPECHPINSLHSDFGLNREPSGIDFLSQKSVLPEEMVLTSQPQDSRLLDGSISQCKLINYISGSTISLFWVCLV